MELTKDSVFKNEVRLTDMTANPGGLGLLAFGMTTIILNMHNAGIFALGSVVFSMGLFYGGLAQIIAGLMEWKKNNTFGMTAFISYGIFWISLVFLILMPVWGWGPALSGEALVCFLGIWGMFSLAMFLITFRMAKAMQVVFGLLVLLFLLLIVGNALGNPTILVIAGIEGVLCGLSAVYTGFGQIMNEVWKETVVRLG
ncbi:acetate uptake transporter [Methanoregula sp.]|uniref:acetate uptake transporter n=1 Tax=Methanoregula sp. TaxID=2052170 RepID=UPI002B9E8F09|nr:acetate uptake transporter [Methanoregula sp.]HVP97342.1 acetate uptake transporter [Methanoregula sp.]